MEAGLDPDRFWSLTPRLYLIHMEAARKRMEHEARDMAWAVWHIAALGRAKRLPRIDQFIPAEKAPPREPMHWKTQLAAWKTFATQKASTPDRTRRRHE